MHHTNPQIFPLFAGLPKAFGSLNNSLTSSGGTINSSSSLNSTPSVDKYAALKDLDEQFREIKSVDKSSESELSAGSNKSTGE